VNSGISGWTQFIRANVDSPAKVMQIAIARKAAVPRAILSLGVLEADECLEGILGGSIRYRVRRAWYATFDMGQRESDTAEPRVHPFLRWLSRAQSSERFSIGLNGYGLKQITDTRIDGHDVSGRREKVKAIGPGFLYAFNHQNVVSVNSYFEQGAENRTEGNKLVINFLHKL
jgi:hypothetical protein